MNILNARKILKNKIIGVTCHNSINLAKKALDDGADYLAFGAFYSSRKKNDKYSNCSYWWNKFFQLQKSYIE